MPRALVIGNGKILVNFDAKLNMRDFYYPYVGQMNHIMGHKNRIGAWVDGRFLWCEDERWQHTLRYLPDSLVTDVKSTCPELGLELTLNDAVHFRRNILLRRLTVRNLTAAEREVRLFFTHDFSINQTDVGDTALFDPLSRVMIHYKLNRVFLIGAAVKGRAEENPFFQYATGTKRFGGAEGTWRDAEDGQLEGNPVAQGSVDSAVSIRFVIGPHGEQELWYWIAVGESLAEVRELNAQVKRDGLDALLHETKVYWQTWVTRNPLDFGDLPPQVIEAYKRSLLVVRTQTDQRGAILAANDTDIMETNRDHYSYLWPRDGALVAYALDSAGYHEISKRFFRFCTNLLSPEGFFWHKYNPDGSLGSSWHPWVRDGKPQYPIQEDETALVLWALWHHYECTRNLEFIEELYAPLIQRAANFLVSYRDPQTHLPAASYDLWEERRGIFTFTAAAVYAALKAAGNFARLFGHYRRALTYEVAAGEVKEAILTYLWDEKNSRFLRGVYPTAEGLVKDYTLESSVFGVCEFGVLPPTDPLVVKTMRAIKDGLWVKSRVGGVARYTNDYYHQKSQDIATIPGNPWFVPTLWLALWLIEVAGELPELHSALNLLEWCVEHSSEAGMMAEQVDPYSGTPLSVSPLTWSHSTYVLAVQRYLRRYRQLTGRQEPPA